MPAPQRRAFLGAGLVAVGVGATSPAWPWLAPDGPAADMHSELVATGLYLIRGGGANTLLRFSARGLVLVDAKAPGNARALMAQVRRIARLTDMPVRALLLTSADPSCTGAVQALEGTGVRLVAQRRTLSRLPAPAPSGIAPRVAFDREYLLRIGGIEARMECIGPSGADADSVVLFPDLQVIALGGLHGAESSLPELPAGGSLVAWEAALGRVLELPFERAVPASGPVVGRVDVEAFRRRLGELLAHARKLAMDGVPKDALMERLRMDAPGWRLDVQGDALDRFLAGITAP
jgi:hypothetical protein